MKMSPIRYARFLAGMLLMGMAWCAVAAGGDASTLVLGLHEQRELPLPGGLARIAVADPAVADVLVLRGEGGARGGVLLVGKKAGTTTVTAWQRNGTTRVWHVQVRGALESALSPQQARGGASLTVSDGAAVIGGQASSMLSHQRTAAAADDAAGSKGHVLDTSTVGTGGVVQVDVKIVEFSKTALKQAGFGFLLQHNGKNGPSGISGSGGPLSNAFNLVIAPTSGWLHFAGNLSFLQSNGLARVLAEPTLVALSGQSASFLAGGELPIPESGGLGTTDIVYKPYGIGLTVTPTVLSNDRIALKVAPEASEIDFSNAITTNSIQIPAITTRRADTTVELGDGESFVISGLVSRTTMSNVDKVPLLGDLPIIGTFFRSLQYSQDEKELVIIVTPHLVKPIAKGVALPLPGQDREQHNGPVWGDYLMGAAGSSEVPGFSK